jgi:hypothetical protein
MHPLPDQPLPEGWVFIEHPHAGRAEYAVTREAAESVWARGGWSIAEDETEAAAAAPSAEGEAVASPRRTRVAPPADAKE